METDPLKVVKGVYESHSNRDTPSLIDLLDPDVEWFEAQSHPYARKRPWRGPDEVVEEVVKHINEDWVDYQTEVLGMFSCGETVFVLGRYTGVYKRTGESLDAEVCTVYTVRDGLIVKWQQFTDTFQFHQIISR